MADISVGDTVCATGPDFKSTARKVLGLHDNGEAECFEVTTKGGAVLRLTAGHRLRTALGYTAVRDLKIDDTVASAETAGVFLDLLPEGGETRVKLTAYMLGDGCCGMSGTWNFTKASSECLDEVLSLDPINTHLQHKLGTTAKSISFRVDAPIRKWITEDGGAGKYSYEKCIPDWVFKLSHKHTALFLSRLWATDGSITSNGHTILCNYVSTSEIMLRQVQSLLRKLGIRSTKDSFIPKYKGNTYRTAYRIRVAGYDALLRFYAELGHVPGRPAVYTQITTERRSTTITAPLAFNDLLRAAYAPFAAIPKRNRTGGIFDRGLKWPLARLSQDKMREWISAFKEMNLDTSALEPFDNGGVWWDTIDSIKSIGVQRVYDMEVEEDHNYLILGSSATTQQRWP
jgi:replicative DNA helicase